jgi:hypothetical protein
MDRSFLSRPEVIAASRSFVCVRVPSYEDASEMQFCRELFVGRSGDVENTTFAILAPDGKTTLTDASRGTRGIYAGPAEMATSMTGLAARYPARGEGKALPVAADVRLGLAIAAGDGLPLVVVVSAKPAALEAKLAELAWSDEFIGRFTYAVAPSAKACTGIDGAGKGVLFVEPDTFGQKGKVLRRVGTGEGLAEAMRATAAAHRPAAKSLREHRLSGIENGVFYDPKLPVTDRQEAGARARTKREIERREK